MQPKLARIDGQHQKQPSREASMFACLRWAGMEFLHLAEQYRLRRVARQWKTLPVRLPCLALVTPKEWEMWGHIPLADFCQTSAHFVRVLVIDIPRIKNHNQHKKLWTRLLPKLSNLHRLVINMQEPLHYMPVYCQELVNLLVRCHQLTDIQVDQSLHEPILSGLKKRSETGTPIKRLCLASRKNFDHEMERLHHPQALAHNLLFSHVQQLLTQTPVIQPQRLHSLILRVSKMDDATWKLILDSSCNLHALELDILHCCSTETLTNNVWYWLASQGKQLRTFRVESIEWSSGWVLPSSWTSEAFRKLEALVHMQVWHVQFTAPSEMIHNSGLCLEDVHYLLRSWPDLRRLNMRFDYRFTEDPKKSILETYQLLPRFVPRLEFLSFDLLCPMVQFSDARLVHALVEHCPNLDYIPHEFVVQGPELAKQWKNNSLRELKLVDALDPGSHATCLFPILRQPWKNLTRLDIDRLHLSAGLLDALPATVVQFYLFIRSIDGKDICHALKRLVQRCRVMRLLSFGKCYSEKEKKNVAQENVLLEGKYQDEPCITMQDVVELIQQTTSSQLAILHLSFPGLVERIDEYEQVASLHQAVKNYKEQHNHSCFEVTLERVHLSPFCKKWETLRQAFVVVENDLITAFRF